MATFSVRINTLFPMIGVAPVLHLACRHTGYGNVFFRKTFVDHSSCTDSDAAGNLDFSENLYAGTYPNVITQSGHATRQDVLTDVHALMNVTEISDAGTSINYQ